MQSPEQSLDLQAEEKPPDEIPPDPAPPKRPDVEPTLVKRPRSSASTETFSKEFAVVSLPGAEQRSADIYAALADIRETRRPAAWFLEYFFSLAPEAYQANGFAKLPDAEFGETLPLRPGG